MLVQRSIDTIQRFFDGDVYHSFPFVQSHHGGRGGDGDPVPQRDLRAVVVTAKSVRSGGLDPDRRLQAASWVDGGTPEYFLGTDNQGRDLYSAILYGSRISIGVGFAAVIFSMVVGIILGLLSGYIGGSLDAVIMRIADIQISFPALLIVLLIDGIIRGLLPEGAHEDVALFVVVLALGISSWPQFARTVRGSTMVEKNKEYVQAARVIGRPPILIMLRHVLPNVMGPVLVIATISLAVAILGEATLSFLGVGVPPTTPSLGTLIRIGQDFLFSGEWWIVIFPGATLAVLVLAVNLLGDWLRDALNPKLR